jgi:hypothetical protein
MTAVLKRGWKELLRDSTAANPAQANSLVFSASGHLNSCRTLHFLIKKITYI